MKSYKIESNSMNDISYLDKDERIKALMFDNINKNSNLPHTSRSLINQKIEVTQLQKFFDKTWERFHFITDSPSFEYKDSQGLTKYTSTAIFKMDNLDDLTNHLSEDIYDFKSIIIYNLYEDLSDDSIKIRFSVIDDTQATIRENRNKKIDQLLDGKQNI
jgi:hypothetical protein